MHCSPNIRSNAVQYFLASKALGVWNTEKKNTEKTKEHFLVLPKVIPHEKLK